MPGCARPEGRRASLPAILPAVLLFWLALVLIGATGCGRPAEGGLFAIERVEAHWANGRLEGRCQLGLRLSAAARDALRHGVPLTVELELILRNTGDQTRVGTETGRYEIRYLPLSEHYQVSGLGEGQTGTFPRLRHALAELASLDFSIDTGALPAGEYELLARSRLDHASMPPPMRLPALFDPGWKHASQWSSWPLTIDPGT
jgi:hypothetical protein